MANTARYKADRNGVEIMNLVLQSVQNFLGLEVFTFEIGTQELDNMSSNAFFRDSEVCKFYPYTKNSDITGRGNTNKIDGVWKIHVFSRKREVLRFILNLEVDEQDKSGEVFKCATKMYQAVDFARVYSPLLPVFTVRSNLIEIGCTDMEEHKNNSKSIITGLNGTAVTVPQLQPINPELQYARICRLMRRMAAAHVHVMCEILRFYCEVGELWSNLYSNGNTDHEMYDVHCFIGNFSINSFDYVKTQDPQPAPVILQGTDIKDIHFDEPSSKQLHMEQPRCTVPSIFGASATRQQEKLWDFWHAKVKKIEAVEHGSFRDIHVQYLAVQRVRMQTAISKHREWMNKGHKKLDPASISMWDGVWYVEDIRQFLMFAKKISAGTSINNFFDSLGNWGLHFKTVVIDVSNFLEHVEASKNRDDNFDKPGTDKAKDLALYREIMDNPPLKYLSSTTRKAPFNSPNNNLANENSEFWPLNLYTKKHAWLDNGLGYTVMSIVDEMENAVFSMWRENISNVKTGHLIAWKREGTPGISMVTLLNVLKSVNSRSSITVRKHHHFEANASFARNNDQELLSISNKNKKATKSNQTLFAMCLQSISHATPELDEQMRNYLELFEIPDAAIFFRMIRCTNVYALQQLQREIDRSEEFRKRVDSVLSEFSLGVQLEIYTLIMLAEHDDELLMYMTSNSDPEKNLGESLLELSRSARSCDTWNNCFRFVAQLQQKLNSVLQEELAFEGGENESGWRVVEHACLEDVADSALAHKLKGTACMWRILMGVQAVNFMTLYEKWKSNDYRVLNSMRVKGKILSMFEKSDTDNRIFKDIRDLQPWAAVALACRLGYLLAQEIVLQTSLIGVGSRFDRIKYGEDEFTKCKCIERNPPNIKRWNEHGGEPVEKGVLRILPVCMPGNRGGLVRNDKEKAFVYCKVVRYNPLKWLQIPASDVDSYVTKEIATVEEQKIRKKLISRWKDNSPNPETIELSLEDYLEIWDQDNEIGPHKIFVKSDNPKNYFKMEVTASSWTLIMDVYSSNHVLISKMIYCIPTTASVNPDTFVDLYVRTSPHLLGMVNIFSRDGESFKVCGVNLCTRAVSEMREAFKSPKTEFMAGNYHIVMGESCPDAFVFHDHIIERCQIPFDWGLLSTKLSHREYNILNYNYSAQKYCTTIACDQFVVTVNEVDQDVNDFHITPPPAPAIPSAVPPVTPAAAGGSGGSTTGPPGTPGVSPFSPSSTHPPSSAPPASTSHTTAGGHGSSTSGPPVTPRVSPSPSTAAGGATGGSPAHPRRKSLKERGEEWQRELLRQGRDWMKGKNKPHVEGQFTLQFGSEFTGLSSQRKTLYHINFYDLFNEQDYLGRPFLHNVSNDKLVIPHKPISIRMLGPMTTQTDSSTDTTYRVLCLQIMCADSSRKDAENRHFLRYVCEFQLPSKPETAGSYIYNYRVLSIHRVAEISGHISDKYTKTIFHTDYCVVDDDTMHVQSAPDSDGNTIARTMQFRSYLPADVKDLQTLRRRESTNKYKIKADVACWICCGVTRPSSDDASEHQLNPTNPEHHALLREFEDSLLDRGSKDGTVCDLSPSSQRCFEAKTITFDNYIKDLHNFYWMPLRIDDSDVEHDQPYSEPGPHLTFDDGVMIAERIDRDIYDGKRIGTSLNTAFSLVKPQALLMPLSGKGNFTPSNNAEYALCSVRHTASEIADDATKGYAFTSFPYGMRDHNIILGSRHILSLKNVDRIDSDNDSDTESEGWHTNHHHIAHAEWQSQEIAHLSLSDDTLVSHSENLAHEALEMWSVALASIVGHGASILVKRDSDTTGGFRLQDTKCALQSGMRGNASLGSYIYYTADVLEEVDGFDNPYAKESVAKWHGHTNHALSKPMKTVVTAFPTPWTVASGEFWRLRNFSKFLFCLWRDYNVFIKEGHTTPYDFEARKAQLINNFEKNFNYKQLAIDAATRDTKCTGFVHNWSRMFKVYHTVHLPSQEQQTKTKEKMWFKRIKEEKDSLRLGIHVCTVQQVRTIFWNLNFYRDLVKEENLDSPKYGIVWDVEDGSGTEDNNKCSKEMKDKISFQLMRLQSGENRLVILHDDSALPKQITDNSMTCTVKGYNCTPVSTEQSFTEMRSDLFHSLYLHSIRRTKKALLWKRVAVGILLRWRMLQAQSAFSCSGVAGKLYSEQVSTAADQNLYVDPVRFNNHDSHDKIEEVIRNVTQSATLINTNKPTDLLQDASKVQENKASLQMFNNIVQYMMNDLISAGSNDLLMQCASDVNFLMTSGMRWQSFHGLDNMIKNDKWQNFFANHGARPVPVYSQQNTSVKPKWFIYTNMAQLYKAYCDKDQPLEIPNKSTFFVSNDQTFYLDLNPITFKTSETSARNCLYRFCRSDLNFLLCTDLRSFADEMRFSTDDFAKLYTMAISMSQCNI